MATTESLFKHSLGQIAGYLKYHRKYIIALCVAFMLILPIISFAADDDRDNFAYKLACSMLDNIVDIEGVNAIADTVAVNYSGGELTIAGRGTAGAGSILNEMNHFAIGIGMTILCCTFFLSVSNIHDRGSALFDFVKKLIFFVAGLIIIEHAQEICFLFANAGSDLAGKVVSMSSTEGVSTTLDSIKENMLIEYEGVWDKNFIAKAWAGVVHTGTYLVANCLPLAMPLLISKISKLIVRIVVWGRAVEIALLAAFSPIAFGDMTGDNFGAGSGSRFLKNYAALCLSGAIIVAEMAVCGSIMAGMLDTVFSSGDFKDVTSNMLLINAVTLAQAALVTRSQQLAKTICGVG